MERGDSGREKTHWVWATLVAKSYDVAEICPPGCSCALLPLCANVLLCPILALPFLSLCSVGSDISNVHLRIKVSLIGFHVRKAFQ